MITVINLFGGPGAGKSTTAAGLFHLMKMSDDPSLSKVELITEYAKRLVWAERHKELGNQVYITAKQSHRLDLIKDQVNYAVTDSPVLLGLAYMPENYLNNTYKEMVLELFASYNNINFFIDRVKPYVKLGRMQTEDGSVAMADKIYELLVDLDIHFGVVKGDAEAPTKIYKVLKERIGNQDEVYIR